MDDVERADEDNIDNLMNDVERADEDNIDNLMNDTDTEFIAEEEITQAASTQDTSLTTAEANLHVVLVTISQKRKKRTKKKNYGSGPKK